MTIFIIIKTQANPIQSNLSIKMEIILTTIFMILVFACACGSYYLKDKYYEDYHEMRPNYNRFKPLNDDSFSEHV
jgi:hypothetical protein